MCRNIQCDGFFVFTRFMWWEYTLVSEVLVINRHLVREAYPLRRGVLQESTGMLFRGEILIGEVQSC